MKERGEDPDLPDLPLPYLASWWQQIGPVGTGGVDAAPLALRHIADDLAVLGIEVEPWEAKIVRQMSEEFIGQQYKSKTPGCPAPYIFGWTEPSRRDLVSKKLAAAFRGLRAKPGEGSSKPKTSAAPSPGRTARIAR